MKNKIVALLICMALSFALIGCGSLHSEQYLPNANDQTTSDIAAPPVDNSEETPPDNDNSDEQHNEEQSERPSAEENEPPQTQIPPEDVQSETDTLLCCTASSLNVRKGAGTSYAILGTLDKGDMVMPVSKCGGWYEILYMGGSAYASASYFTEVEFAKAGEKIEQVIAEGKKLLGIPYVYGAQRYHYGNGSLNPNYDGKSYDCSSLMQYIFKIGADVDLAMTSREQSLHGKEISKDEIKRGDLLFFTNASRVNKTGLERIGHVAMYLGDNIILHTASDHAVIEPISATRSSYFITARRMID